MQVKERTELLPRTDPESGPKHSGKSLAGWLLKRRRVVVGILILGFVGITAAGLYAQQTFVRVQSDVDLGRKELLAGVAIIKQGGASLSAVQSNNAAHDFRAAEGHFGRANGTLQRNRLITLVAWIPGIHEQVVASKKLTDMGTHLSHAGDLAAQALVLATPDKQPKGPGERILKALDALDPSLKAIMADVDAVADDRKSLPSSGLLPPLARAVNQFDAKIKPDQLQQSLRLLRTYEPVLRQILGASEPRSYLVLQQDPAELRATGGFIGSIGYLTFQQGRMAPYVTEDVYSFDGPVGGTVLGPKGTSTHIDAPYPLDYVFKIPSWTFRDSNWSPDFPIAARQAQYFLERETHRHVDGVIAIDPFLIAKILTVLGPTQVPGDIITAENFFSTTINRVELHTGPTPGKSFLSQAAQGIFARVLVAPSNEWLPLMQVVQSGCETRSIQVYFNDPQAEAFVSRYNCGGQVQPIVGDGLLVVESNVGGNKDDFWMRRHYSLRLAIQPSGAVVHTLVLHYDGLNSHGPLTGRWGYTGWLRVYLPPSSDLIAVAGARLDSSNELGRLLVQGWFYVQFGSAPEITIVYRTSPTAVHSTKQHLEVFWQKQAGRLADPIHIAVTLPPSWKLVKSELDHEAVPNPITTDLSIDRDLQFWFQPN